MIVGDGKVAWTMPTSWAVGVGIVAGTILWRQIRLIINDWRLHRRKQKYPYMVICRPTPKRVKIKDEKKRWVATVRTWGVEVVDCVRIWTIAVMRWTLSVFLSLRNSTVSIANILLMRKTNEESHHDPQNNAVYESFSHQVSFQELDEDFTFESSPDQSFGNRRRRHSAMLASPTILFDKSPEQGTPEQDQRPLSEPNNNLRLQPRPASTSNSITISIQKSGHELQSHYDTAVTTLTTYRPIDSSSLSEKIRKRRSNGEDLSLGRSGKKRRLNDARITLQGCALRPRASWQYRPSLNKRELERREERILDDMNRKRIKLNTESGPAPAPTGSVAGAPPPFQFGGTSALKGESKADSGSDVKAPFVFGRGNQQPKEGPLPSTQPVDKEATATFRFGANGGTDNSSSSNQPSASISQTENLNSSVLPTGPFDNAFKGNATDSAVGPSSHPDSIDRQTSQDFQHLSQQQGESIVFSTSAGQQSAQPVQFGSTANNENEAPGESDLRTLPVNGSNSIKRASIGIHSTSSYPNGMNGTNKPTLAVTEPPPTFKFGSLAPSPVPPAVFGGNGGMNGSNGTSGANPNPYGSNGSNKRLNDWATTPSSSFIANANSTMPSFALGTNGGYGPKSGLGHQGGTAGARRRAARGRVRRR